MIARATAALPFIISMPQKTEYALASYEDCGYTVVVYPPIRVDQPLPRNRPRLVVDGTPAFDANGTVRCNWLAALRGGISTRRHGSFDIARALGRSPCSRR